MRGSKTKGKEGGCKAVGVKELPGDSDAFTDSVCLTCRPMHCQPESESET